MSRLSSVYEIPRAEEERNYIKIRVKNQYDREDDAIFYMKMRRSTQLGKLMTAYSDHIHTDRYYLRFLFDGTRIRSHQTPDDLEMEDGDMIDCMMQMIGG